MYKKIKNGSFMNWIWFIICILPLMFIFCDYINNSSKYVEGEKVDNYIIYKDMTREGDASDNIYVWANERFTVGSDESQLFGVNTSNTYNYWLVNNSRVNAGFMTCFYLTKTNDLDNLLDSTNNFFVYIRLRSRNSSTGIYYYWFEEGTPTFMSDTYFVNDEWQKIEISYNRFNSDDFYFYISAKLHLL